MSLPSRFRLNNDETFFFNENVVSHSPVEINDNNYLCKYNYLSSNQVLTLLLRLGHAVIVDGHSQGDDQEEGEESHSIESVSVHLGDRVLVDLTHLLLDSDLHIEAQTLCKVGQGLSKHNLDILVGAS